MARVRIYRPTKTAMQSGIASTRRWVLEYEPATPREPDPLMGWASAGDTLNEVWPAQKKLETLWFWNNYDVPKAGEALQYGKTAQP